MNDSRYGDLLTADTWSMLAHEYLNGPETADATDAALDLAEHLYVVHLDRDTGVFTYRDRRWITTDGQPYDGLADLTEAWDRNDTLRVSSDYMDHPVWLNSVNLRFRIWHDTAHVRHGLGFGVDDELKLWALQALDFNESADLPEVEALFCESVYQLAAFVHLGEYPDHQRVVELGPVGRQVARLLLAQHGAPRA